MSGALLKHQTCVRLNWAKWQIFPWQTPGFMQTKYSPGPNPLPSWIGWESQGPTSQWEPRCPGRGVGGAAGLSKSGAGDSWLRRFGGGRGCPVLGRASKLKDVSMSINFGLYVSPDPTMGVKVSPAIAHLLGSKTHFCIGLYKSGCWLLGCNLAS